MNTNVKETLHKLHKHACGYEEECAANEDDPKESGVCDNWDALRDAFSLGVKTEREEVINDLRSIRFKVRTVPFEVTHVENFIKSIADYYECGDWNKDLV
jgi:hypothetical protein